MGPVHFTNVWLNGTPAAHALPFLRVGWLSQNPSSLGSGQFSLKAVLLEPSAGVLQRGFSPPLARTLGDFPLKLPTGLGGILTGEAGRERIHKCIPFAGSSRLFSLRLRFH